MIGHLPSETSAATFSDFLYVEGITNMVEAEKEGWAVWIHSEDQLEHAKDLLKSFLGNPTDPKYHEKARSAAALKERESEDAKTAEKRTFDRKRLFGSWLPYRFGPLTFLMILASVGAAIWSQWGSNLIPIHFLLITEYAPGLREISRGEIWRAVTPIFVHFGIAHLVFNMLWLADLGSMIEARKGTLLFAILVIVIAATSNLAQFFNHTVLFGGMSGVVYGLLGYAWMKGKFDPGSGIYVHPQTMIMMVVWLVLCMTPLLPFLVNVRVANTTHVVGLVVGGAWGYLSSLPVFRNRSG